MSAQVDFSSLVGKTLVSATSDESEVRFEDSDGVEYRLMPEEPADARVEDICGDLSDLVGSPVLFAEKSASGDEWTGGEWTFYRLGTIKGSVVIRFFGESEYSAEVWFCRGEKRVGDEHAH